MEGIAQLALLAAAERHAWEESFGGVLKSNGDLVGAKARLGHDNLSTTLRNYVDDDGIDDRGSAMSLDELYNNDVASRSADHDR